MTTEDIKLISKMYDGAGHRYMYGFNREISEEEFEKVKPYMKDYRRKDFENGTVKVTGRPDGWMCTREDAPKIEETLGITDTLEKREKEIEELFSNPKTKQETKDKAMNELEIAFTKGSRPEQNLSRLLLHSSRVFDPADSFYEGKNEGTGTLFIYTPHAIWYIMNNGTDGSNSTLNNVKIPNGGAIGLRLIYDDGLDRLIRIVTEENEYKGDVTDL